MQQNEETQKTEAPTPIITEIMGLSLFNDVSNKRVQAFNRCIILLNLDEEERNSVGEAYFRAIGKPDQVWILAIAKAIKDQGFDKVRSDIQSTLP